MSDSPLTCEIRTLDGQSLGVLVLASKTFKSGKEGYFGQAKVVIEGTRYQCQAQLVAIASKPSKEGALVII